MAFDPVYHQEHLSREELNRLPGTVVVEFGANWCGICRGFSPTLESLLKHYPDIQHMRIEDGPGKPLGRSFRVKLWPTLIFMRDGQVLRQLVRPSGPSVASALTELFNFETPTKAPGT